MCCETVRGESRPSSITSPCFSLRILLLVSICTAPGITGRTEWSSEVGFYIKHSYSWWHRWQRSIQKEALELQQQQPLSRQKHHFKALPNKGIEKKKEQNPRKGHLWRISELPLALQLKRQWDQFCYSHWKKSQHGTESPYHLFQITSTVIWHFSSRTITCDQMFWLSLLPSQLCFPVTIVACMHLEEAQLSLLEKMQHNSSLVGCNSAVRLPEA